MVFTALPQWRFVSVIDLKLDELEKTLLDFIQAVQCNIAQAPADNEWQCLSFHLPG